MIDKVEPGSIAEELELAPGDVLIAVNGQKIEDVFDYHYLIHDEYITVLVQKPNGEEWELEIEKDYDEDLGITFENGLMDDYRSCRNKCIFCFIDQMPKGMRETLYEYGRLGYRTHYPLPLRACKYLCAYDKPQAAVHDAQQPFCGRCA